MKGGGASSGLVCTNTPLVLATATQRAGNRDRAQFPPPEKHIHVPPPHPSSQSRVWKSTLGSWKERPFGNIGNSAGRCHYLLSGGCLWCLKGTTPPSKPRLWPKTTEGLLAARETQRFSPSPNHKLSSLSLGHEKGPGPYNPSTRMVGCLLSDIENKLPQEICLREATHLHVPSPVAFHLQWIRGKNRIQHQSIFLPSYPLLQMALKGILLRGQLSFQEPIGTLDHACLFLRFLFEKPTPMLSGASYFLLNTFLSLNPHA